MIMVGRSERPGENLSESPTMELKEIKTYLGYHAILLNDNTASQERMAAMSWDSSSRPVHASLTWVRLVLY